MKSIALAFGFALAMSNSASAMTAIFEDEFDEGGAPFTLSVTDLDNWAVTTGNVDIVPNFGACGGGDGCLDLDGSFVNTAAKLVSKSTFSFLASNTYKFEIFVPGVNNGGFDGIRLSVTNIPDTLEITNYTTPLTESLDFIPAADVMGQLMIEVLDTPNNFGPLLSRATLSTMPISQTAPVPLPAALPLLILALGALGLSSRRRA